MTCLRYASLALIISAILVGFPSTANSNTPNPTMVVVAGNLQSQLGCSNDWDPTCQATKLGYDATDDVWQATFNVPAGNWEYKAALNGSWTENYGANATADGANIGLSLSSATPVKFYYDHKTHWITSSANSVIATVAGSFQSEIGCSGDWQPDCLRSWLEDPSGSGIYSFTTTIPGGNYEAKVAINESWNENYGQGGVQNGPNIPFTVPGGQADVTFTYNPSTHSLTISAGASHDNNVEWDGLRHDSRDLLYRSPGGAVAAGTPVKIRFRTFHNDVTSVLMRVYDVNTASQTFTEMNLVASDVSCYQAGLGNHSCDFWEATLSSSTPDNLWYRFIVSDGTSTAYYADNTSALDGGLGAPTSTIVDNSYALMFYDPAFAAPAWPRDAVIYQIFPDRFRNGRHSNDPHTGDPRYDDPVLALPWGTLPEGYCRNYAEADSLCPWRFDNNPPSGSTRETPRGRDYFGGDVKGIDQELDYLQSLGVTTLYLNPIFDSASNHGYDTQNYLQLDPYFGTQQDWDNLAKHTTQRGMRIILDGVFNHMSSDSPFFDRYRRFTTVGACESASSQYRSWFFFRPPAGTEPAPCAPSESGGPDTFYTGWFGFDSLPVLNKSNSAVQKYFVTGTNSVTRRWLQAGASGWRLDVMGDPSFPDGYWESFRSVVKQTKPSALIVGELWQKDSTLLRFLRGDRADSTMDYRLRDAVVGFLAPQSFDSKGFPDSGRQLLPSEFAARLSSIREDYPDSVYYSLMNLLDSHDTERLLWTLTPGTEDQADKELNAANLTEGKRRLQLASLIQFSLPGAPTIYYGDEVGMTGDDDPDDRRTYPWPDLGGTPDTTLFTHYQSLISLRKQNPVLTDGDFRSLLADDANQAVAIGRKTGSQGAVLAINRSPQPQTLFIPVSGYFPNGLQLSAIYGVDNPTGTTAAVSGGVLQVALTPESGVLLATSEGVNLTPPEAVTGLHVTNEGNAQVSVSWNGASGTVSYNVYHSPVSGGGYIKVNSAPVTDTSFTDTGLSNAVTYYYVVTAVDSAGNESGLSDEVSAMPHYVIGWANLQWPPTLTHTISAVTRTDNVYGQVWIDGVTNQPGQTPTLRAQLGFGPENSDPSINPAWSWVEASFNTDAGNNDEFVASLLPDVVGTFDYAYRYTTTAGRDWVYADRDGTGNGYSPSQAGKLTVNPSSDTTAPFPPANLRVSMTSPASIALAWDAVTGDATLYGYEVLRGTTDGGPYAVIGTTTGTGFADSAVVGGTTYYYVVRSVDLSFNRSTNSNQVSAQAAARKVTLVFNVTVPASTDGTGRSVYVAGTLSQLDGNLPDWNPGGVVLTRIDSTHWTITLSGSEGVQLQYKYALGSWDYVEKDASCGEIANRMLTLNYGSNGTQVENDVVPNWRNVAPCGN
ncbi:MAG: alpha-amylase family glycosyl hydrolase [Chlamydiota bacterium]